MKNHIYRIHEGNKDHKCKSCGKSFSLVRYLNRHIYTVHEEGNKDYKCESCGKSFTRNYLYKHIHIIHGGRKDHKCESCGKPFSQPQNLKKHIRTVHEERRDHKCNLCSKSFKSSQYLNIHINKKHEGRKNQVIKVYTKKLNPKNMKIPEKIMENDLDAESHIDKPFQISILKPDNNPRNRKSFDLTDEFSSDTMEVIDALGSKESNPEKTISYDQYQQHKDTKKSESENGEFEKVLNLNESTKNCNKENHSPKDADPKKHENFVISDQGTMYKNRNEFF